MVMQDRVAAAQIEAQRVGPQGAGAGPRQEAGGSGAAGVKQPDQAPQAPVADQGAASQRSTLSPGIGGTQGGPGMPPRVQELADAGRLLDSWLGQGPLGFGPGTKPAEGTSAAREAEGRRDMWESEGVGSDPRVIEMLSSGFYVPMTALTNESLRGLHDGSKVKMTKSLARHASKTGAKGQHVLDIAVFPGEISMSVEDWREAWQNFIRILPRICSGRHAAADIANLKAHYDHLTKLDYFRNEFDVVIRFDIWARTWWFTEDPTDRPEFSVATVGYLKRLNEIRLARMQERMNSMLAGVAASRGSAQPTGPSNRYQPYQPYKREAAGGWRGNGPPQGNQSFRPGGSGDPSGPICLICGERGHMARACGKTTLRNGKKVYAAWDNDRLIGERSRQALCAGYNVGGFLPCKSKRCPDSHGCHRCSLCGAADHHAASGRCV